MLQQHALADREQGQYPLSIATSLALESATNIHEEIKHPNVPLLNYGEFWINLRTLFRNMLGSMPKESSETVSPTEVVRVLLDEMDHIESIVHEKSHSHCKVVFYVSNYAGLQGKYPRASIRGDKTPKQQIYTEIQKKTIQALLDALEKKGGHDVRVFSLKIITKAQANALIITHYPYDLVSQYSFTVLDLLESHTGAIKPKSQFYTKYIDGKHLPMIPFREDLLQVFGDKETFHPMDIKVRRAIIDLATECKWTPITTKAKIAFDLDKLKAHPFVRDVMKAILV